MTHSLKSVFSHFFILFFITISFTSCSPIWLKFSGVLDEAPKLKVIESNDKKVVYLPLHHIGRKEYYKDMADKIDSFNRNGFVTFYEMVNTELTDTAEYMLLAKKFRKIQGDFDAGNGYLDTINHTIMGTIKYNKKYDLINQPSFLDMNLDTLTAVNADVTLEELLAAFEKEHGEVKLDQCDLDTPLQDEYTCNGVSKKLRKAFGNDYALEFRNENLAQEIHESTANKIFVIYGARHFKGLFKNLRALDTSWKKS